MGAAPREDRRHQSRFHRAGCQRPTPGFCSSTFLSFPRRDGRRGGRHEALLGARVQPGRDVHHDLRSGSGRDRSEGHHQAAVGRQNAVHAGRHDARARARRAQCRRHVSGLRRRPASGQRARAVPVFGHALRRPERPRAARAAARTARASRFRRLDEPGGLEGGQHARRARREGRPHGREALSAGRGIDIRHGQQPARIRHGLGVFLRTGAEPPPPLFLRASH